MTARSPQETIQESAKTTEGDPQQTADETVKKCKGTCGSELEKKKKTGKANITTINT